MRLRLLVCITILSLCHLSLRGQAISSVSADLPDDPSEELLPVAQPEDAPATGTPVRFEAQRQSRTGDTITLSGEVVVHYRDYVLRADQAVYHPSTTIVEAEGHLQLTGGAEDLSLEADRGEMRLNANTARFYHVTGSVGVRKSFRSDVFSTANPLLFSGRVLLQTGKGQYRILDGTMTNCRLPKPDWQLLSRSIDLANGKATTTNAFFKVLNIPVFYLPYLRHPVNETGRESGFMIPSIGNSSVKGFTLGEQFYWVINRSMDMVVGSEYYSKRGWAPNGDFRYKGNNLDHLTVRWNALLDRGIKQTVAATATAPATTALVNQGGVDVAAIGRKDFTDHTHIAGNVEYLSSYVYRLVFDDNLAQATSSEVASTLSLTHMHNGIVTSGAMNRFQTFASSNVGDEARILHLPSLRYDVLDRPLGSSSLYWGLGSSLGYLGRSEPHFHARNVGRLDLYPRISLPISSGGWSLIPEVAIRDTFYSVSQNPNLNPYGSGTPRIRHELLNRGYLEAAVDIRPPAVERDFTLSGHNRVLRHVLSPELTYHFVGGIGDKARNVLLVDTTDIATDTNEAGYALTQRLYLRPSNPSSCTTEAASQSCPPTQREWASWRIEQKFFLNPDFGGALISNRRNVFASTLDLTGIAFLSSPRNISPVTSRLRFEAIDNLRIEWDLDYDPKAGRLDADNLYAGYSFGRSTVGIGHALLNAVDEQKNAAAIVKSQLVQPFFTIGKPSRLGFNFAANAGYDFDLKQLQYAGAQAVYNWDCCGLTVGYRRFQLGALRDETQYLYSFTIANFGSAGDIRRSNSVFRDPNLPPAY